MSYNVFGKAIMIMVGCRKSHGRASSPAKENTWWRSHVRLHTGMNRICDSPVFQRDAGEEKSVMLLDVVFQDKTTDEDMPLPHRE